MRVLDEYVESLTQYDSEEAEIIFEKNAGEREEEEIILIRKAKEGDAAAFGELYGKINISLYRYAVYITGSKEDAEDAVQDAVINAWKNINKLRETERFKTWLFRILQNECRHTLKKRSINSGTVAIDDYINLLSSDGDGPSSTGSGIIDLVKSLPPPDGQLVMMSVIGGFNSSELARIFLMPPATVRTRISRSMKKLKKIIKEADRI
ncbi:MAG: RNA polymerase sigma factor [Clostridia bacterium]|nr:RNA polymerase sigma factor [Clostridia bacterium]